jgi:hypothetical protein
MENLEALTPERMTEFLSGSAEIDFTGQSRAEKDAWVESTLAEHRYFVLGKKECGHLCLLPKPGSVCRVKVCTLSTTRPRALRRPVWLYRVSRVAPEHRRTGK